MAAESGDSPVYQNHSEGDGVQEGEDIEGHGHCIWAEELLTFVRPEGGE